MAGAGAGIGVSAGVGAGARAGSGARAGAGKRGAGITAEPKARSRTQSSGAMALSESPSAHPRVSGATRGGAPRITRQLSSQSAAGPAPLREFSRRREHVQEALHRVSRSASLAALTVQRSAVPMRKMDPLPKSSVGDGHWLNQPLPPPLFTPPTASTATVAHTDPLQPHLSTPPSAPTASTDPLPPPQSNAPNASSGTIPQAEPPKTPLFSPPTALSATAQIGALDSQSGAGAGTGALLEASHVTGERRRQPGPTWLPSSTGVSHSEVLACEIFGDVPALERVDLGADTKALSSADGHSAMSLRAARSGCFGGTDLVPVSAIGSHSGSGFSMKSVSGKHSRVGSRDWDARTRGGHSVRSMASVKSMGSAGSLPVKGKAGARMGSKGSGGKTKRPSHGPTEPSLLEFPAMIWGLTKPSHTVSSALC